MTKHNQLFLRLISANLRHQLSLPAPRPDEINALFSEEVPRPIVMTNERGTVWLDPYYAAFQLSGGKVHYVFISAHHINEEMYSEKQAAGYGRDFTIPDDIREQFSAAARFMKKTGSDVWVEVKDYSKFKIE